MRERGFFEDPIHELHHLNATLFRAARIIVDTSLHLGEMTFEEAVTFMMDKAAMPEPVARAEVGRYCWWPTQASSYLTGCLEILAIRERYLARARLRERVAARRADRRAAPVPRRDRVVGRAAAGPRGARGRGRGLTGDVERVAVVRAAPSDATPRAPIAHATTTCSPCSRSPVRACTTLTRCRSPSPGRTWRLRNSSRSFLRLLLGLPRVLDPRGVAAAAGGRARGSAHRHPGAACHRVSHAADRRDGVVARAAPSRARGSGPRCVRPCWHWPSTASARRSRPRGRSRGMSPRGESPKSSATSRTANPSWRREALPSSSTATGCGVSAGIGIDIRSASSTSTSASGCSASTPRPAPGIRG